MPGNRVNHTVIKLRNIVKWAMIREGYCVIFIIIVEQQ